MTQVIRKWWIDVLKESQLASNYMARAYNKEQMDLHKEYDPGFDKRDFIEAIAVKELRPLVEEMKRSMNAGKSNMYEAIRDFVEALESEGG